MGRYISGRLVQAAIVVWIVATFVFVLVRLTPGDPAIRIAGPDADLATVERIRENLGLNDSIATQYVRYLGDAVQGDFGDSTRFAQGAMELAWDRFPATLELAFAAFLISATLGIALGLVSATWPGSVADHAGKSFAVVGQSMPTFWIGLLLILIFSVNLRILPTAGTGSWRHFILPAVTLGWFSMTAMLRLTRSAMLDEVSRDYMKLLRAKGLSERRIMLRHALRNASIPIFTMAGLQFAIFLSGSVVVETVFAWPGVGRLMVESVAERDYPVVQAATFLVAITLVLLNLFVDLSYGWLDPRVRVGRNS